MIDDALRSQYGIVGHSPLEKVAVRQWLSNKAVGAFRSAKDWLKLQGQMLRHPVQATKAGWESMAPGAMIQKGQQLRRSPQALREFQQKNPLHWKKIVEAEQSLQPGKSRRLFGLMGPKAAPAHLAQQGQTLRGAAQSGGAKGVAEELSRRGWTGAGKATKYIPVGGKTLTTGFAASGLHAAVKKPDPGETKSQSVGREAGSTFSYIAGAPMGLPGIILSSTLLGRAGALAGKTVGKAVGQKPVPMPASMPEGQYQLTPAQRQMVYRASRTGALQASRS